MQQQYQTMGSQSQTMAGQGQMIMKQPPQVITTKDLLYLKDQMSWQLDATKKCAHFANECTDPQIKQMLDQTGKMHLRHYQMLLRHTQNNNNQHMSQMQRTQTQQTGQQQAQMPQYS